MSCARGERRGPWPSALGHMGTALAAAWYGPCQPIMRATSPRQPPLHSHSAHAAQEAGHCRHRPLEEHPGVLHPPQLHQRISAPPAAGPSRCWRRCRSRHCYQLPPLLPAVAGAAASAASCCARGCQYASTHGAHCCCARCGCTWQPCLAAACTSYPWPSPALPCVQTIAEGKRTVNRVHKAGLQMHIYTLRNEPK